MFNDPVKILKTKSLPEFLILLGIPLVNTGKNYSACCPFHHEKTPSFSVSPESNRWKCFGACGVSGDIFEFIQRYKNFTFPEALEFLCNHYGLQTKISKKSNKSSKSEKSQILEINFFVAEFYQKYLCQPYLGIEYLKERKSTLTICKEFLIGYAPHSSEVGWNLLFDEIVKQNFRIDLCEKIGLIKKSKLGNYYDCFHGRIIFPIFNLQNDCIGFNTRLLSFFEKSEYRIPKYLLSKETEIFNRKKILYGYNKTKQIIDKKDIVCIVEGIFDFLRMYSYGIKNCIPLLGGEFSENLEFSKVSTYYLLMDNDSAGVIYNNKIGSQLLKEGKQIRICNLQKDPDECSKKEIGSSLKESEIYLNWVINQTFKYPDSIEHKLNILENLRKLINGIPQINLILYCNDISQKLNLPLEVVIPFMTFGEVKYKEIIEGFCRRTK